MNAAAIEALIDPLDRAGKSEPRAWRRSLAIPGGLGAKSWETWLVGAAFLASVGFSLMQRVLERLDPALERAERLQTLSSYFLRRDCDEDQERTSA